MYVPEMLRHFYSTITSSSSSRSPWFHLIHVAIAQNNLLFGKSVHALVIMHGHTTSDRFLTNNLINMYSKCGELHFARRLFDIMPQRDLVTWNSILTAYASCYESNSCNIQEGFTLFRLLIRLSDVSLTKLTFAPVLKLCSISGYVWASECVHGYAAKIGLEYEELVSGALVNIYIKYGRVREARMMFDEMAEYERDVALWNMMLRAYVKNGLQEEALHFLSDFHRSEIGHPDIDNLRFIISWFDEDADINRKYKEQVQAYAIKLSVINDKFEMIVSWNKTVSWYYQSLVTAVVLADLKFGVQIHGMVLKTGFDINVNVSNSLVNMYSKMDYLTSATKVFFEMEETDVVSWNLMIACYVQSGLEEESVGLYMEMLDKGVRADQFTFASVLRACSSFSAGLHLTKQIHVHAMKYGHDMDSFVSTALVGSYSNNGSTEQAESVFLDKDEFDLGLWNAMILGFVNDGNNHRAWELFTMMHSNGEKLDAITLATLAKACGFVGSLKSGRQIHGYVLKFGVDQDLYLGSSLVDMYIKCGELDDSHKVFEKISCPDNVVWTCMISGSVENRDENRALLIYNKMRQLGVIPDEYTFATLIKACSHLTALEQGRQVHANAIKSKSSSDTYVSTSLIDFYAKCGSIEESYQLFNRPRLHNIVLWNAMLVGLAQYGHGNKALELFNDLKFVRNILPDRVTFIGVLSACAHSGLISEAYKYFKSMTKDYGIEPEIEHYSCLVDGLSRAGCVQEAEKLIALMPFEACGSMYRTLLGACWFQGDMETGKRVATKLLKLEPFDSSTYVLLSNTYAACNQWSDVADARKTMKSKNVKKDPGFSRIDVRSIANVFVADDRSHPQREMIYEKLKDLIDMIKEDGYIDDSEYL